MELKRKNENAFNYKPYLIGIIISVAMFCTTPLFDYSSFWALFIPCISLMIFIFVLRYGIEDFFDWKREYGKNVRVIGMKLNMFLVCLLLTLVSTGFGIYKWHSYKKKQEWANIKTTEYYHHDIEVPTPNEYAGSSRQREQLRMADEYSLTDEEKSISSEYEDYVDYILSEE